MTATHHPKIKSLPAPDPTLDGKPEACIQFDRYLRIATPARRTQLNRIWNNGDWATRDRLITDCETMRKLGSL